MNTCSTGSSLLKFLREPVQEDVAVSLPKVSEISATSTASFEILNHTGIARAHKSLRNIPADRRSSSACR